MAVRYPFVPKNIVVHLGKPDESARNITVDFTSYIKNVAASELFPTWPNEALKANIYAIISFTMNRIYNEWYKSKGKNFDITSSPIYDQTFKEGRSTYENIDNIVDQIFNNYIIKNGQIQPFFAAYCDGRKTTCPGLSQWGSVTDANNGMNYLQILKKYYGNDISIKYDATIKDNTDNFPGFNLNIGSFGNPVLEIQRDLRRIRQNYPAIPPISNTLGIYDEETKNAVKKFQEIFNLEVDGIVGKATWYKINYVYNSVKKLSELYSEGLSINEATFLYSDELNYGDTGIEVEYIHYFLDALAFLDDDIPRLKLSNVYDDNSVAMVKAFQTKYNLPVTGKFTYSDFKVLKDVYDNILRTYNNSFTNELYPDYFLVRGMKNDDVKRFQKFLLKICLYDKSIPGVRVNGEFDELTEKSVLTLQKNYGFDVNGIVGPLLWNKALELSKR